MLRMGCLVNKGLTVKNKKRNLFLLQNPIWKYIYMEDHIEIKETQLEIISTEVEEKENERTNDYLEDGLEDSKIDIKVGPKKMYSFKICLLYFSAKTALDLQNSCVYPP